MNMQMYSKTYTTKEDSENQIEQRNFSKTNQLDKKEEVKSRFHIEDWVLMTVRPDVLVIFY